MDSWLEMLRSVFNYALRERKDWTQSRKCAINACFLSGEYITAADAPYPDYYKQQNALTAAKKGLPHRKDVQSQVIQEPLRRVDAAFVARKARGHNGFAVKTVRVVRKHSGWYATLCIQADESIPDVAPHGHSIGIDVGLEYFLSTSDGLQVERPRFFGKLQRKLKLLQRRLKRKQPRSNNLAKLRKRIGRVYEQIAAVRLN